MYSRASGLLTAIFKADGSHWLVMANKKRRRSNRNFVAKKFTQTQPLGTLGSVTAIASGIDDGSALTTSLFIMSVHASWTLKGFTRGSGDGPIVVGFAHGDYSVTEIKEALEVALLGPASKIEQERSRRLVRQVGILQPRGQTSGAADEMAQLNDGDIVKTKLNWVIEEGQTLNVFAYNSGSGALATGAIQETVGSVFGRWMP